jgi:hypothetical protein
MSLVDLISLNLRAPVGNIACHPQRAWGKYWQRAQLYTRPAPFMNRPSAFAGMTVRWRARISQKTPINVSNTAAFPFKSKIDTLLAEAAEAAIPAAQILHLGSCFGVFDDEKRVQTFPVALRRVVSCLDRGRAFLVQREHGAKGILPRSQFLITLSHILDGGSLPVVPAHARHFVAGPALSL